MRDPLRRATTIAVAASLVGVLALAGACASDSKKTSTAASTITLSVDDFGSFGYDALYKQYEAAHPNIKIVERNIATLSTYTPQLQQHIAAGAGAGDIVAIEEGIAVKFMAQPDKFVDLNQYGGAALQNNFLPWKWTQGHSADGSKLIGLGTDVGGLAMCYRKDLFAKAGLPTDRAAVGALWPTWDAYLKIGQQFKSKVPGNGFVDGATNLYNTILMQAAGQGQNYTYFDKSNNLVVDTNPAIKTAFDETVKMSQAGLSSKLQSFTDAWATGFKKGQFATIACPAWMLGLIQTDAGDAAAGKWDVASLPGGGGSWGGSFLAVPTQSQHPKEAAALAEFLSNPQGQIAAFKAKNNLPSSPEALSDPAVTGFQNTYFSNAPVGQIYATGATSLKPVYLGSLNQEVRTVVENDLLAIDTGQLTPAAGWTKAIADAKRAAATG